MGRMGIGKGRSEWKLEEGETRKEDESECERGRKATDRVVFIVDALLVLLRIFKQRTRPSDVWSC